MREPFEYLARKFFEQLGETIESKRPTGDEAKEKCRALGAELAHCLHLGEFDSPLKTPICNFPIVGSEVILICKFDPLQVDYVWYLMDVPQVQYDNQDSKWKGGD